MSIADGVRKFGFRRWYERQLIEAHACLVTAFLGVIMIAVCLDQFRWRDTGMKPTIMLGLAIVGILLCVKTVRAYFTMLFRAERYAQQSVCGHCNVYCGLHVVSSPHVDAESTAGEWLRVRCRKCGHDWTMSDAPMQEKTKNTI